MASNQTEHYGLNQWGKTDPVRVEDFNADNRKIEAALVDKASIQVGVYSVPEGHNYDEPYHISLGRRPKGVWIWRNMVDYYGTSNQLYSGFLVDGYPIAGTNPYLLIAEIEDDGFLVKAQSDRNPHLCSSCVYCYVAFF